MVARLLIAIDSTVQTTLPPTMTANGKRSVISAFRRVGPFVPDDESVPMSAPAAPGG